MNAGEGFLAVARGYTEREQRHMAFLSQAGVGISLFGLLLLGGASVVTPQSVAVRSQPVAWVVFVDDLHLDFRNTGRIRELVQNLLNEMVREDDVVTIRSSGPSAVVTDFASPNHLVPFIKKLTGSGLRPSEIVVTPQHSVRAANELQYRTRVALSNAAAAVSLVGQTGTLGRRAVLYISNGYSFDISKFTEAHTLARLAGTSGVRIFAINGGALGQSMRPSAGSDAAWERYQETARDSLRAIAESGSGFAVLDAPILPATLRQISDSMRR
jgi:hypothetical protein